MKVPGGERARLKPCKIL